MRKLFFILAFMTFATSIWAYDFTSNGIYYTITSATAPYTVEVTHNANSDGSAAYNGYSGTVTLPASVTNNGLAYAVSAIGINAFCLCTGLTTVNLPTSVTTIKQCAFQNSSLSSIELSSSVIELDGNAFYGCTKLTAITASASSATYFSEAGVLFSKDKSILQRYPPGKTDISYTIPSVVTTIGSYAFRDCSKLSTLTIPTSVTTISDYAFYQCSSITSLSLPASVTTIGAYSFRYCNITELTLPQSLTSIGEFAFASTSLKTIVIPSSITSITNDAFTGSALESIIIPSSVTRIGSEAFYLCWGLKTVTLPSTLTTLEKGAFSHCDALTAIDIPSSVTSMGANTFDVCTTLTSFSFPSSISNIPTMALSGCSGLKTINIPSTITSIGTIAFYGCTGLSAINIYAATPPDLSASPNVFQKVPTTTCVLHVPAGSKKLYAAANQWSAFTNIVEDLPAATFNTIASKLKINITNNKAELTNLPLGESVTVYNLQGVAIYNQKVTEETISVNLPARGMYIVKVGSQSLKVIN